MQYILYTVPQYYSLLLSTSVGRGSVSSKVLREGLKKDSGIFHPLTLVGKKKEKSSMMK